MALAVRHGLTVVPAISTLLLVLFFQLKRKRHIKIKLPPEKRFFKVIS